MMAKREHMLGKNKVHERRYAMKTTSGRKKEKKKKKL